MVSPNHPRVRHSGFVALERQGVACTPAKYEEIRNNCRNQSSSLVLQRFGREPQQLGCRTNAARELYSAVPCRWLSTILGLLGYG